MSLTVTDIFWPISTRSRQAHGCIMHMDAWMHGCISGLILHGAFQTKFLGILYHKLSTFMVIRRGAGSFKCHFRIFVYLENFFIMTRASLWHHGKGIHLYFSVINWSWGLIFL